MKYLLKNRNFMTTLVSDLLSNFGDVMYSIALMNYVLQLPDTKSAIAIVSFSEVLPIFAYLLTGYFSDRTNRKINAIIYSQLFRMIIYLVIGFVMQFSPQLWIVIFASVLNVFSDCAGQYESGLFIPVSLKIVEKNERQGAIAFRQGVSYSFNVIYQPIAAILIGIFSYSMLSYLNAMTFLLSSLILLTIFPALKKIDFGSSYSQSTGSKNMLSEIWGNFKQAISEFKQIPELKLSLQIVPVINGLFAALPILVVLTIDLYPDFIIYKSASTIAIINMFYVLGNIVGSFLAVNLLSQIQMKTLLKYGTLTLALVLLGFHIHQPYLVIFSLFIGGILIGAGNPKFNLLLYEVVPMEKIATLNGGIMTYLYLGMFVIRMVISTMVVIIPTQLITATLLIIALGLLGYTSFYKGE
ncbi:MFS transporter [Streptococcus rifensis]